MISCLINPASGGGRTARLIPHLLTALEQRFGRGVRIRTTRRKGDAEAMTRSDLRDDPHATIIAVGGDGTFQEVANGWMNGLGPAAPEATLGLISSGTGQGLAQGLGLPRDVREQLDIVGGSVVRRMDLGHVTYHRPTGGLGRRWFVNECQIGLGAAVVRAVESKLKRWNGTWTFGVAAGSMLFRHRDQTVHINVDEGPAEEVGVLGIVIGNGEYTGGGMHLTPGAVPFDGRLELLIMKAQPLPARLANLGRIYSARHVKSSRFSLQRITRLDLTSTDIVEVEADGEYLGFAPCRVTVADGPVRVLVPRSEAV